MSKASRFPDTLVLIFALVVLAQLSTYTLSPGTFTREPDPTAGTAYVDGPRSPLRERLVAAMANRSVTDQQLADLFQVSSRTVHRWKTESETDTEAQPENEAQPEDKTKPAPREVRIEAEVGALLDAWVRTGEPPTEEALDGWKAAAKGRKQLVPGTYKTLPEVEQPWHAPVTKVFTAIPRGLSHPDAVEVIMFVFLIGGVIAVMRATGAFDALIGSAIQRFGRSANVLIAGTIGLFAAGSGAIGMAEEYVPFIALLVTMSLALGLDAMVGISIVLVGYAVGYGCAPVNPFTVIIAQGIADLPPSSGWWYRILLMLVCLVVGIHHVLRYAHRVRSDPQRSLVRDIDYSSGFTLPEDVPMTNRRLLILVAFAACVAVFVYGVASRDWYLPELSALFLALGVLVAIVGGVSPNRTAKAFCVGAGEVTTTALLIGFARTIQIVLDDAQITDTVVQIIADSLRGAGAEIGAVGMLLVQTLCNFFIPSGSGQAYVTMPIMAPLATELGIEKQVAVLAYQMGDGFTNVVTPTNAAMMGMLAIARVPYQRWLKFVLPLMIKLYIIATIGLIVGVWIGYS